MHPDSCFCIPYSSNKPKIVIWQSEIFCIPKPTTVKVKVQIHLQVKSIYKLWRTINLDSQDIPTLQLTSNYVQENKKLN